ncbi:MAG: SLBB domain-containing protein, partial [Cyanobacteria bacterium NC_groundwater_1444_Ag_S-0.65um_54_12]|nr:SLBB domain-containing protein [Cyanobacteria bacterium NC_groundwater_1444_Ag_S-0.65um_54_12]
INNVETIANIPWIIRHGGAAYAEIGVFEPGEAGKPPKIDSRGTRLMCLSGQVNRPGVYEIALGMPLADFIEQCGGGVRHGHQLKAVIPGGSSTPVLTAAEALGARLTYEDMTRLGTMFGSGGMILIGEQQCMVRLLTVLLHFYAHESCGQCSPCREGTDWLYQLVCHIEAGKGKETDLQLIRDICQGMEGRTVCPLAAAATMPTMSYLTKYRSEFEAHIAQQGCPQQNGKFAVVSPPGK